MASPTTCGRKPPWRHFAARSSTACRADTNPDYQHWYLPAIRELVGSTVFREEPRWIAAQLVPRITPAAARAALKTLLALGLLERDAHGCLRQTDRLLTTGPGPLGHHVVNYHRAMLERASEAIERVPRGDREISSLTLCVSQNMLQALKQRIVILVARCSPGQFRAAERVALGSIAVCLITLAVGTLGIKENTDQQDR